MIIEKLEKQTGFTDVEKGIAKYLLENGFEIRKMSISTLAQMTYTSPAAITRFCRKLGLDGYKQFRILFNAEYESYKREGYINANKPFSGLDSLEKIARNLSQLNQNTIDRVIEQFDYAQLRRVAQRMHDADVINIIGVGTAINVAMDFQLKMLHFGKPVNLTQNSAFLPGYALTSTDKTVNLIISQSGETREVLECLWLLESKNSYCVAITASPESRAAKLCQEVISVAIDEEKSYASKIDSFAVYNAFHFVLDCMFAFMYRLNFDHNEKRMKDNADSIKKSRQKK